MGGFRSIFSYRPEIKIGIKQLLCCFKLSKMLRFSSKSKTPHIGSHESMDSQLSSSSNENLAHSSSKEGKEALDKILHQRIYFKVNYPGVVKDINITNSKKRDTD